MTDACAELAMEVAAALGAPGLTLAVVPHPFGDLVREAVLERSRQVLPEITARLLAPADTIEHRIERTPPRVLSLVGSWEVVNAYFYAQGWTDGLPTASILVYVFDEQFADFGLPSETVGDF